MSINKEYFTFTAPVSAELTVLKSRFIGKAMSVTSVEKADNVLRELKAKYHDATHHPFTYLIGTGDECIRRCSDDGEPPLTSGKPIQQAIERKSITNIILVVIRYFGGKKLGTGGLSRAYGECAEMVLNQAQLIPYVPTELISEKFTHSLFANVMKIIKKFNCETIDSSFKANAFLTLKVPSEDLDTFKKRLKDITKGEIKFF